MGTEQPQRGRKADRGLSVREVRFCVLYAESDNATQAYRDAGFPPQSAQATWCSACRLLRKQRVRDKIRTLRADAAVAAGIVVAAVARGLYLSAEKDLRQLYDERGRIKLPHEWPDEVAAVVEGVESEERFETVTETDEATGKKVRRKVLVGYVRKVKTTNRTDAQKTLAQWLGMVGADKQDGSGGGAVPPVAVVEGPEDIPAPPRPPGPEVPGG